MVASSSATHSSPFVHTSADLSAFAPGSPAATACSIVLFDGPPMANVTFAVTQMSSPGPAASALVHDLDEEWKTALDMVIAHRLRVNRLASDRFAEAENACAD